MSFLSVPTSWKGQMAIAAAVTFATAWTVGYFTKPVDPKQKRNKSHHQGGGGGGGPPGMGPAERKLERLFKAAEGLVAQGNWAEAELTYIEALEALEDFPDPGIAAMLENVMCVRIAMSCEKQAKYEEAEKYYLRAISNFEGRPLQSHEVSEYGETLEKLVELCMTKLNNPHKAVKPLTLWLKLGEEMSSDQIVLICSNLLGKIKATQDKYDEAETYCKRVLALTAKKPAAAHEDLTISTMINLASIYHKQGKHEANKKLLSEMGAFISSSSPAQKAAAILGSVAEQAFDFGYFQEALSLFQRTIELCGRFPAQPADVQHYENALIQTLAELGLINEAREKLKKLIPSLGAASPPLTISQYLQTGDALILDENGQALHHVKLSTRESKTLPSTAVLVCKVEHPEPGQPDLEARQMVELDRVINFKIPIPHAKKGYYIAQIDVYSDATHSQKLSSHLVLSQCEEDVNLSAPVQPAAVSDKAEDEDNTEEEEVEDVGIIGIV